MLIPFLIVSSLFTPPFVWLLIYFKILPPENKTKAWARADLVKCTLKHFGFYIWFLWALFWGILVITVGF